MTQGGPIGGGQCRGACESRGEVQDCNLTTFATISWKVTDDDGVGRAKGKLESISGEFKVEHVEVLDDLVDSLAML